MMDLILKTYAVVKFEPSHAGHKQSIDFTTNTDIH